MTTDEIKTAGSNLCKEIILSQLDRIALYHAHLLYDSKGVITPESNIKEMASGIADILASMEACVCTCFNEGLHESLKEHCLELCAAHYRDLCDEEE